VHLDGPQAKQVRRFDGRSAEPVPRRREGEGPASRGRRLPHRVAADQDDAIARLVDLVQQLAKDGIKLEHVDIGGGLGIDYGKGDTVPSPAEYGKAVRSALAPLTSLGIKLFTEPGRVIVGQAGALVSRVLYRKRNEAKHFTIIDGAMNDLLR